MRKTSILITLLSLALNCFSQSGAVKKTADAVFSLTTFKSDGSILATSNGVFVSPDGTAISPWQPFVGASRAVVVDSKGKKHDVDVVVGANAIYDLVKFRITDKAPASATIASGAISANTQAWVVPNRKSDIPKTARITAVETFMDKYSYYIVESDADGMLNGCPVVDSGGKLLGILNSASATSLSVTDANYALALSASGTILTDATLNRTDIRIALPADLQQAQLALMLANSSNDTEKYKATADDFIRRFPKHNDGYYASAAYLVDVYDYQAADKVMQTALKTVDAKDEAHSNYARIILLAFLNKPAERQLPDSWTLDKALAEVREADAISPQFSYRFLEGQILYAQEEYQQAYDHFMALSRTEYRSSDVFYEAMKAKSQLDGTDEEILALLDSAVAVCDTPYTNIAAPYFLARAIQYDKMADYRNAMLDFLRYESVAYTQLGAEFYYMREQSEAKGKFYQPALNDIAHAIALDPQNTLYWAELASVNLRVRRFKEAIVAAGQCIKLEPEYPEAYLILGIAQVENGDKTEGMANIEKAKSLGNQQADSFLDKYR